MSSHFLDLGVPDLLRRAKLMRQIHYAKVFPSGASVALFAAMALEAYPHDLALFLEVFCREGDPPSLLAARSVFDQLEQDRVQLKAKYSILYYVLSGRPLPKGEQPFQDLALLIDIRNQIAHFKPTISQYSAERIDRPKTLVSLLERISQKKIIDRDLLNEPESLTHTWTMVLDESDRFVEWSLDVVYRVISFMHDAIPECDTKARHLSRLIPALSKDDLF